MAKNDNWTKLKNQHLERLINFLAAEGEEVQRYASNKIGYPICNDEGDEAFFVITLSKPAGSRDGEPFDGYVEAENYKLESETKAKKQEKANAEKLAKIERDKKMREKRLEIAKKRDSNS
jgi:hypothetical protein